jgi:hypothetical protein
LFGDLARCPQPIPVERRQFELRILCCSLHLLRHLCQNTFGVTAQEGHQLFNRGAILVAALCTNTGTTTHLDMVVEAWASVFARDFAVAVQVGKHASQCIQRGVAHPTAAVGTEVARAVFLHSAHDLDSWKRLLHVDLDKRKVLVVLQAHVVVRLVLLNQLVLEDQRLEFGLGHPP